MCDVQAALGRAKKDSVRIDGQRYVIKHQPERRKHDLFEAECRKKTPFNLPGQVPLRHKQQKFSSTRSFNKATLVTQRIAMKIGNTEGKRRAGFSVRLPASAPRCCIMALIPAPKIVYQMHENKLAALPIISSASEMASLAPNIVFETWRIETLEPNAVSRLKLSVGEHERHYFLVWAKD